MVEMRSGAVTLCRDRMGEAAREAAREAAAADLIVGETSARKTLQQT